MDLKITPQRAKEIEHAIEVLRKVKAKYPDEPAVDEFFQQIASDNLIDLYEDWKQLRRVVVTSRPYVYRAYSVTPGEWSELYEAHKALGT